MKISGVRVYILRRSDRERMGRKAYDAEAVLLGHLLAPTRNRKLKPLEMLLGGFYVSETSEGENVANTAKVMYCNSWRPMVHGEASEYLLNIVSRAYSKAMEAGARPGETWEVTKEGAKLWK